jgi:prepilin peptidase dependent protein B
MLRTQPCSALAASHQRGFTLTELLIGTALSLTVISAVLISYVGTFTNSMNTLASSKLNHELATLMSLMSSDIRRAGFWGAVAAGSDPVGNVFQMQGRTLTVFDSMAGNNAAGVTGSGSCIVYAYDLNRNGMVEASEMMGFRLNNGVVQTRQLGVPTAAASCASAADTWADLTDSALVTVTNLSFDLADSVCLNTREPDGIDNDGNGVVDNIQETDCYRAPLPVANSGDITIETRHVRISLEGHLTDDAFVRRQLTQEIRVRNDRVRIR